MDLQNGISILVCLVEKGMLSEFLSVGASGTLTTYWHGPVKNTTDLLWYGWDVTV